MRLERRTFAHAGAKSGRILGARGAASPRQNDGAERARASRTKDRPQPNPSVRAGLAEFAQTWPASRHEKPRFCFHPPAARPRAIELATERVPGSRGINAAVDDRIRADSTVRFCGTARATGRSHSARAIARTVTERTSATATSGSCRAPATWPSLSRGCDGVPRCHAGLRVARE